ncbi:LysM peptidoglycan-binding domain-containing protein [Spirosoma montaniterrae]|uniref:Peptidoglycan-binding protein n=1 Tax=Spirosoma montaniterrae TaxID=1178516 RepID=A0A1P9X217_9BACT|nr:LysM peptidoglycan-binding domain-containing protein [Spirosoma montaniterrae]AQG81659.1 peptidoglycan-binding protein [Spirosoma montaniterrae]
METDNRTTNPRPASNSNLPAITLVVLIGIIAALLYVGYDSFIDNTDGSDELTSVALDTMGQQPVAQNEPDMLMAPEEVDTSSQPMPVDLSQATPPADVVVANTEAEDVATSNRETTDGKPAPDEKPVAVAEKPVKKEEAPKAEKPKPEPAKEVAVVEKPKVKAGGQATTHTVGTGETFYGVANRYNMKIATLKQLNPGVTEQDIKAGVTKLNVRVRAVHTVGPGDVLRVVAEKYGVSKEALMRANKKSKDIATRGEKLIIPFPEKQ